MKINSTMVNAYFKTKPTTRTTPINQAGSFLEVLSSRMDKMDKIDTITISQKGMISGITKEIAGSLMDINSQGHIQEIQQAVNSGSYSVSVEDLAGAMMRRSAI